MIYLLAHILILLAFIILLGLFVRYVCCIFSSRSRKHFLKHPIIHITLTVICVFLVVNQACMSFGHGAFDIPVRISSDKEIEKIEYCAYHSLGSRDEAAFKKGRERWFSIRAQENGEYYARVTFSGGSNGCFTKQWSYIHSEGIGLKVSFSDGSESIVRLPLQNYPRPNIIELEL